MTKGFIDNVALILAAHGDRGGKARNRWLAAHVAALSALARFRVVAGGALNGEPSLEDALRRAGESGAAHACVYPLFMSDGYFADIVLPERIETAGVGMQHVVLPPLGLDPRLPELMLAESLKAAQSVGIKPAAARLLVVGHGSKYGPANANATKRMAAALEEAGRFAQVGVAFLEEAPFLANALAAADAPTVVAGFFTGDGMHAGEDIPSAISAAGAQAVYTGAIGAHAGIPRLIETAVSQALLGTG